MPDPVVQIRGAGPVGILTALFLVKYGWTPSSVQLIDPGLESAQPGDQDDPRILALSQGTLSRLGQLGIDCQPVRIQRIHVSSQGHFGSMEIKSENAGVPELGGLVPYSQLLDVLRATIKREGLSINTPTGENASAREPSVHVIAEGGLYQTSDRLSQDSGMKVVVDYAQHAVIGWAETASAVGTIAYERFIPNGAVALLPMKNRYALIWCCSPERSDELTGASTGMQCQMLSDVMGGRLGAIKRVEITGTYPLGLKWRDQLVQANTVWIGNSAQTLHPIAGQGLNLGFRDAETLASCLLQRGRSIADRLQDYAQRRQTDRWTVRTATDALARASWVRRSIGPMTMIPGAKRLLGQVLMFGG